MKLNNMKIPNTNITLSEFKEVLYERFKGYPIMKTNYKNNTFVVTNTYYEGIDITVGKIRSLCNKLGIKYTTYVDSVIIELAK